MRLAPDCPNLGMTTTHTSSTLNQVAESMQDQLMWQDCHISSSEPSEQVKEAQLGLKPKFQI